MVDGLLNTGLVTKKSDDLRIGIMAEIDLSVILYIENKLLKKDIDEGFHKAKQPLKNLQISIANNSVISVQSFNEEDGKHENVQVVYHFKSKIGSSEYLYQVEAQRMADQVFSSHGLGSGIYGLVKPQAQRI